MSNQSDYAISVFEDYGCKGLYNGLNRADIRKKKGLKPEQNIWESMDFAELAANYFRITQTEAKIMREGITGKDETSQVYFLVGAKVRQTITELSGILPEDLPMPQKRKKSTPKSKRHISTPHEEI